MDSNLSKRDESILDYIFQPPGEATISGNPNTQSLGENELRFSSLNVPPEAKSLEWEGIRAAEEGRMNDSIHLFTKCITQYPDYCSVYNNRAQAHIMSKSLDLALQDLVKAVDIIKKGLATKEVARQVYSQRGFLYLQMYHGQKLTEDRDSESGAELCASNMELHPLEELAKDDLEVAANLGCELSKRAAAKLNPYAKLCGAMVSLMMKSQTGEG